MISFLLLFFLVATAGYGLYVYNRLVRLFNYTKEAWSGIDVQLKKRHELVPLLVKTVKGYAAHERNLLETITALESLRSRIRGWKRDGLRVGFVPTMGNLHAGHLALVEQARALGDATVASIFVNRLQFLPHEDFDSYPRTFESDCAKLQGAGCDVLFAPREADLYPETQTFKVVPDPALANRAEILSEAQKKAGEVTDAAQEEKLTLEKELQSLKAAAGDFRKRFVGLLEEHKGLLEASKDLFEAGNGPGAGDAGSKKDRK